MVARASRRIGSNRWSLSALAALALAAALLGIGPARAATEEPEVPRAASASLEVGEFPGQIGEIVQNVTDQLVPTRRYRGTQRFDTARLIGLDAFDNPHEVVIARGDLFPDALAGSYLAGQRGAPILLTSSHRLEPDTLEALQDLDPNMVTLVGGTEAIAFEVASELGRQGFPTNRLGGADRFDTAAQVATIGNAVVGERDGFGRTAIVARADEFADALVAGSLSFTANYPLLLTRGDELHPQTAATLDELAIDHVIVPGGQAAVSSPVIQEMEADGIDVQRVAGVDRVATSVEFARFMREELGFGLERINTAIGTRFPDALALAGLSGSRGQPIVLTANEDTLGGDGAVQDFLAETCAIDLAGIAGGHAAITPELEREIRTTATSTGAPCQLDLAPTLAAQDLGTDHTLTGTLSDNGGEPVANEDVRIEVYRATDLELPADLSLDELDVSGLSDLDTEQPLDELLAELDSSLTELDLDASFGADPVETFVDTTDANGKVTATYTGPETLALDVAVACLDDESESCALLSGGEVVPQADLLTASAVTLWAVELDAELPNLLLAEPPLAVRGSGGSHRITATALDADLDAAGDLGSVTDPSSITQLGDLADVDGVDPDQLGQRVSGVDVRFEVYRASAAELPDQLLDDVLAALAADDPLAALRDLLESVESDLALDAVGTDPLTSGVETTDGNGEADFVYDGPPADDIALDLAVACFDAERDRCTTVVDADLQLPDEPGTAAAAALWAPDLDLANLLLADPVLDTNTSGGGHDVTATALNADDLDSLASTMATGTIADLVGEADLDPDSLGERVTGEDVRFEVYRATTELPQQLLDDVLALLNSNPADLEGELTDLLGAEDADAVLGALATDPIATATEITDDLGEAVFSYDGVPAEATGADLIVACLDTGGSCTSIVDGDLQVADEPGTAAAAGLWAPALLDLDPLADVGEEGGSHTVAASADRVDGQAGDDLPVRFEVWRAGDVDALLSDLADLTGVDLSTADDLQGLLDAAGDLSEDDLASVLGPDALADMGLTRVDEGTVTTDSGGEAAFGYAGAAGQSAVDVVLACPGESECGLLDGGVLAADETRVPTLGSMLWIDPLLDIDALTVDPLAEAGEAASGASHDATALAESLRFDAGGTALPDSDVRYEVYRTTDQALLEDIGHAIDEHDDVSLTLDLNELLGDLNALLDPELDGIIDQGLLDAAFDQRVAEGVVTTDSNGQAEIPPYEGSTSGDAVDLVVTCPADGTDCATLDSGDLGLDAGVVDTASMLWLDENGVIMNLIAGLLDLL